MIRVAQPGKSAVKYRSSNVHGVRPICAHSSTMASVGGFQNSVVSGWLPQKSIVAIVATVGRRRPQHAERRVEHLRVAAVAEPEVVVGLGDVEPCRPHLVDRLDDRRRGLVDHQVVPLVVDVERRVGTVVVVVGRDRDLQPIGHRRADEVGDPLADHVGVGAEDHVEVGGDDDRDLLAPLVLEGDRRHLHVVVHPVRVGVAVADGHPTLVPRRHEEPR